MAAMVTAAAPEPSRGTSGRRSTARGSIVTVSCNRRDETFPGAARDAAASAVGHALTTPAESHRPRRPSSVQQSRSRSTLTMLNSGSGCVSPCSATGPTLPGTVMAKGALHHVRPPSILSAVASRGSLLGNAGGSVHGTGNNTPLSGWTESGGSASPVSPGIRRCGSAGAGSRVYRAVTLPASATAETGQGNVALAGNCLVSSNPSIPPRAARAVTANQFHQPERQPDFGKTTSWGWVAQSGAAERSAVRPTSPVESQPNIYHDQRDVAAAESWGSVALANGNWP
eukprot:TRINITY_DN16369_c0_g1_i1.p1 TRINITY_DN16369_c0_g1~~TRINITY_DN16369_c0_g1_i1.p1  ORF type:complete len:285 (-),score=40.60 TRINITY_DN16369_c0_g1_i1:381-1235(-)